MAWANGLAYRYVPCILDRCSVRPSHDFVFACSSSSGEDSKGISGGVVAVGSSSLRPVSLFFTFHLLLLFYFYSIVVFRFCSSSSSSRTVVVVYLKRALQLHRRRRPAQSDSHHTTAAEQSERVLSFVRSFFQLLFLHSLVQQK